MFRRGLRFLSFLLAISLSFISSTPSGSDAAGEGKPPSSQTEDSPSLLPARQGMKIEKGVFLIADLRLVDPNFSKTVVLITQHGAGGSVGVVINRPTSTPLSRALPPIKALEDQPGTLFVGGPVQREVMILLCRTGTPPESASPVFEKVYFSLQMKSLNELLTRAPSQDRFRIYSGYAGWSSGQLQREIDRGDWRILPADADLLFQEETDSLWETLFRRSSQQSVERDRTFGRSS